ncbi:MAG: Coenzyme F420 hydrogenase/dehydrogenase, beta subunit C-terminal domain [Clostridia bacterium]|nr:Coenzyme F420 hydrogenase/dehydrogenase, beta subunit C-terminal domain [Clostridia bacterium]
MRTTVRQKKAECTGCGACVSVCPKAAITMKADEEGFLYPSVDPALCISCDLCEKKCPVGQPHEPHDQKVIGAQNKDADLRRGSSSGGVFTALAKSMIAQGGVVFGAAFDEEMRVEHIGAFDEADLALMRGSKYVQSDSSEAIAHAKALLERGIPVLFSGTPCQIDGLLACVKPQHQERLLTVDFVCHGVPSPGVFASYLRELEAKYGSRVTGYTFRDKRFGWKNFAAVATFADGQEHIGTQLEEPYLRGFLKNLYLRPSCTQCHDLRGDRRRADITMADLWGAQEACPHMDNDTGLSLLMINTPKGRKAMDACARELTVFPMRTEKLLRFNPSIEKTAAVHEKRAAFFAGFAKNGFETEAVEKLLAGPGRVERMIRRIAHLPKGAMRRLRALLARVRG